MFKIKPLTKDQIIISIDRLTRFKHPEEKYLRVFKDILVSNLISPKFKRVELDEMSYCDLRDYAQKIINYSLKELGYDDPSDYEINEKILINEDKTFIINSKTKVLLENNINYQACVKLIGDDSPVNLLWLKSLTKSSTMTRERDGLRYPLEKIVISEGITEEILLPKFASICD